MRTFMNPSVAGKARRVAVAAVVLMASVAAASAKGGPAPHPANANQYYGLYENSPGGLTPAQIDHRNFERAGTRGREDLGASPFHPEGPGNVVD
jgi:hypothetical protein